jgi:hypothetical protein
MVFAVKAKERAEDERVETLAKRACLKGNRQKNDSLKNKKQ